jgi:PAS domain S-box-containing protein
MSTNEKKKIDVLIFFESTDKDSVLKKLAEYGFSPVLFPGEMRIVDYLEANGKSFDAILYQEGFNETDEISILQQLLAKNCQLPIIIFSSAEIYSKEEAAYKAGAFDIFTGFVNIDEDVKKKIKRTALLYTSIRDTQFTNKIDDNKYKSFFGNSLTPILCTDLSTGKIAEANDACEKLFNLNREDIIGQDHKDFLPKKKPFKTRITGRQTITEDAVFETEGITRFYRIESNVIDISKQRYLLSTFYDVTSEKKADLKLKEENQQIIQQEESLVRLLQQETKDLTSGFREILKSVSNILLIDNAGIWFFDKETKILQCQMAYDKKTGEFTSGEQVPLTKVSNQFKLLVKLIHTRNFSKVNLIHEYLHQIKQTLRLDIPLWKDRNIFGCLTVSQDRSIRQWKEYELNFLLKVTHIIINNIEINERRKAEEALKESEEQYQRLFENMINGFALLELIYDDRGKPVDAKYLAVNQYFEELVNVKRQELVGKTHSEYFNTIDKSLLELLEPLLTSGRPVRFEYSLKEIDKIVEVFAYIPREGQIGAMMHDITERKKAESSLKKSEAQLKELNQTKDKFFSIIAHDLKNPFNFLMGFSSLLQDNIHKYEIKKSIKYAGIINDAAKQGYELLENLLEWSRSQTGAMQYTPVKLNLYEIVEDTLDFFETSVMRKNIELISDIPKDTFVTADKYMLMTILRNLISNAVKFTNPEGQVMISCSKQGDFYKVSVLDTGIGIDEKDLPKLFRIDVNPSRIGTSEEKGTGLGLILCKEFVMKNGGEIQARNREGQQGAEISFTIPVHKEE